MSIFDYYNSLSIKQKTAFRNKCMEKCGISYPSFQLKVKKQTWSKLEKEAVENIIKEEISNAGEN